MAKNLPIYQFLIDEDEDMSGVKTISLVEDPAMMTNFIAFEAEEKKPKYVQFENYEQVVFGISLQPDIPIYRIDDFGNPYYGIFTKDTIKKIVYKFHKEQQTKKVNLDHNSKNYIDAFMFSDYIVDSELQIEDLKKKGIPDAKIGSWVVAYKIEDKNVFEKVLNGEYKGFSIECFLDTILVQMNKNIKNKIIKTEMKKNNKTILEKIVNLFKSEEFERSLVNELGFEIEWSEVGQPVNKVVVDTEGNETMEPVGMGEFITEEGIIVTDEASNLVEIRELPTEPETEEPELVLPDEEMEAEIPQIEEKMEAENVQNVEINKMETEFSETKAALDEQIQKFASLQAKFDEIQKENEALKAENETLKEKLKEPINEPILEPVVEKKEWAKMSAYERALERARKE